MDEGSVEIEGLDEGSVDVDGSVDIDGSEEGHPTPNSMLESSSLKLSSLS